MRERIGFQEMVEGDDGFGGVVSGYQTVFEEPATMAPSTGSEITVASRLQGIQPYTMTIRSSERTRRITTAWRAFDARQGMKPDGKTPVRAFDIKAVANPDRWNGKLQLLVVES
ncbi:head-tail adaptor protein [Agrobacterium salinitolerans]|uniref:head-tail adaptor protein n=1 Tax=Agrobacterium salinitolerans TaxID=1183413 RepID=UPI0022B80935|nr:head-tail adaptor protein [Agrobacterium salinitolerans]MCZ7977430.1 head-tail adaptor protein [Agrobacterium salinitolerans]